MDRTQVFHIACRFMTIWVTREALVIDKKWFIRIEHLWGFQVGGQCPLALQSLLGYSFIIKGKVGGGEDLCLCLSCVHVMLPSSAPPGWSGVSFPYMVKLGPQIFFSNVHITRIINLLSSCTGLGSYCFNVLLFGGMSHASITWFCC